MKLAGMIYNLNILFIINFVRCTIDGISYMDELKFKDSFSNYPKRDNPCNPLYWYPKPIPDYCHIPNLPYLPNVKIEAKTNPPKPQTPAPSGIEVPVAPTLMNPPPLIPPSMIPPPMIPPPMIPPPMIPSPMIPPPMIPPPMIPPPMIPSPMIPSSMNPTPMIQSPIISSAVYPSPMIPSPLVPSPILPPPSHPFSATNSIVPVMSQNPFSSFQNPQYPYTYGQQNVGMVPGLPGIVSRDGGINILPFSDAYSELLEKHKQKLIRRKLEKILKQYEDYPRRKHFRRRKKFEKMTFDHE